jgi:hypothetical protein
VVPVVVAASEWHCGGRQGEGIKELYGGRAEQCGGRDGTGARRGVNSAGDGIDAKRWRFVEQGWRLAGRGEWTPGRARGQRHGSRGRPYA